MYTSKQIKAIFDFFDTNQVSLVNFYKQLIDSGAKVDKEWCITIKEDDITRSLLCNKDYVGFRSEETIEEKDKYSYYKKPKTYGRFSIWSNDNSKNISSDGSPEISVFKYGDELHIQGGALGEITISEFYELTTQHIKKLQEELNLFAGQLGVIAPILQTIPQFLTTEILSEKIPLDPANMKLRDYGFTTIVASAIKSGDYVILGRTHSDCGSNMKDNDGSRIKYSNYYDEDDYISGLQFGYITSDGYFVMPGEAWEIADKAGQIDTNMQSFTHYSEDFYSACSKEFDIPYARQKIRENLKLILQREREKLNDMTISNKSYEEKRELQNQFVSNVMHGVDEEAYSSEASERAKRKILNLLPKDEK